MHTVHAHCFDSPAVARAGVEDASEPRLRVVPIIFPFPSTRCPALDGPIPRASFLRDSVSNLTIFPFLSFVCDSTDAAEVRVGFELIVDGPGAGEASESSVSSSIKDMGSVFLLFAFPEGWSFLMSLLGNTKSPISMPSSFSVFRSVPSSDCFSVCKRSASVSGTTSSPSSSSPSESPSERLSEACCCCRCNAWILRSAAKALSSRARLLRIMTKLRSVSGYEAD